MILAAVHTAVGSVDMEHIVHKTVELDVVRIAVGNMGNVSVHLEVLHMPHTLHVEAFRPSVEAVDEVTYAVPNVVHVVVVAAPDEDALVLMAELVVTVVPRASAMAMVVLFEQY